QLVLEVAESAACREVGINCRLRHTDGPSVDARLGEREAPSSVLPGEATCTEPLDKINCRISAFTTSCSLLGPDDDHSISCFGSVDGRGRCSLEHFQTFNVVGVEIGNAVDAVVLVGRVGAHRRSRGGGDRVEARLNHFVAYDHTVDYIERVGGSEHRCHSTKSYLIATTRRAGIRAHLSARNPPGKNVFE